MSRAQAKATNKAAAAGGESPGTHTSAAEKANSADVSSGAAAAALEITPKLDAAPTDEGKEIPLEGATVGDVLATIAATFDEEFGADQVVTHLFVRAVPEGGFRRAGRHWPAGDGVRVPVEELTGEQVLALLKEPLLVVVPAACGWTE